MAINFPSTPSTGTTYAYNGVLWTWNSYAWDKTSGSGATGATGATGPVGDYVVSVGGKTGTVGEGITSTQILYWNSNDVTGSNNFTFDGTDIVTLAETGHLTGRLLGPVLVPIKNTSGVSIAKGTPVYATGSVGASGEVEVAACDASNSAKMPSIGLADSTLGINGQGHAVVFGVLKQLDTSGYSPNGTVFVAAGGGLTGTKPTGANDLIQNIGRVVRVQASTGEVLVSAIGRSNDVPNILQARSWLQMPDGMTATGLVRSLNGFTGDVTATVGSGLSVTNSSKTITFTNTGVLSFNGLTGGVTGVTTSAANTFIPVQTFNSGISASGATFNGIVYVGNIKSNTLTPSYPIYINNAGASQTFIGDWDGAGANTYILVNDDNGDVTIHAPTSGIATYGSITNDSGVTVNDGVSDTTLVGSGAITFVNSFGNKQQTLLPALTNNSTITLPISTTTLTGNAIGNTFTALQTFTAGITTNSLFVSQGATFTGLINSLRIGTGNGVTFNNTIIGATGAGIALTTGMDNFFGGSRSGDAVTTGNRNIAIGTDALGAGITVSDAIGIGHNALLLNTADNTIAIGSRALDAVTTGTNNLAIGVDAASAINTGISNVAIGTNALKVATTVNDNVAIGYNALQAKSSSGGGNVGIGTSALYRATTCQTSTAVGYQSQFGSASVTAQANTSLGYNSMVNIISGSYNSAFGVNALYSLTGGAQNTAVGTEAVYAITNTSNNTGIGQLALRYTTTGAQNVAIGYYAGAYKTASNTNHTTSGDWNVYIGSQSRASGDSVTNEVVIGGQDALGIGSNTTTIGNSATTATKLFGVIATGVTAPTIASAATIAPTARITFVSGVTTINTITPPAGITLTGGQIILIPTGLWATGTSGNIALATTAVVNKALIIVYDAQTAKWYPSY